MAQNGEPWDREQIRAAISDQEAHKTITSESFHEADKESPADKKEPDKLLSNQRGKHETRASSSAELRRAISGGPGPLFGTCAQARALRNKFLIDLERTLKEDRITLKRNSEEIQQMLHSMLLEEQGRIKREQTTQLPPSENDFNFTHL